MAATFTHLLLWNSDDLALAFGWVSIPAIKQMYRDFDWRFWRDNGMRDERIDEKDLDPHYREMLKVK